MLNGDGYAAQGVLRLEAFEHKAHVIWKKMHSVFCLVFFFLPLSTISVITLQMWRSLSVLHVPDEGQWEVLHLSLEDLVKSLVLGHGEVILPVADDAWV